MAVSQKLVLILIAVVVGYYLLTFKYIQGFLFQSPDDDSDLPQQYPLLHLFGLFTGDELKYTESYGTEWISFSNFVAIPFFYVRRGDRPPDTQLITIVSICDLTLLYEARQVAIGYPSGPLSFAFFLDENYEVANLTALHHLIHSYMHNITNVHDITVGIMAINTSNTFYKRIYSKFQFNARTPLQHRIPTNALRNLAEAQVSTDWLFNIDIDFWYLSDTLKNEDDFVRIIENMNSIINETQFDAHTVFIVPAFEIIEHEDEAVHFDYSSVSRKQLLDLVYLEEISPFHVHAQAQRCTNYREWYAADRPYVLDLRDTRRGACHYGFEPWFIMLTSVSRQRQYQWDTRYIGRGLNKVERVYKFRHFCFNFIVLHDAFMIHARDSVVSHGVDNVSEADTKKWYAIEDKMRLFEQSKKQYKRDANSCLTVKSFQSQEENDRVDVIRQEPQWNSNRPRSPATGKRLPHEAVLRTYKENKRRHQQTAKIDEHCTEGIISDGFELGHCRICCPPWCGECGGFGCGRKGPDCCLGPVVKQKRYCNESIAPCELTLREYCPHDMFS